MATVLERWDRAYANLASLLETVADAERAEHAAYYDEMVEHLREHTALLGGAEEGS